MPRFTHSLKWGAAFIFLTVLLAVIAIVSSQSQSDDSLPRRGQQLASAADWDHEHYEWLSPDEILYLREASQGDYAAIRAHVVTGVETSLTGLEPFLTGHEKRSEHFAWTVSPNGRWLMLMKDLETNSLRLAVTLDGTQERTWFTEQDKQYFWWMPDNQGWVELSMRTKLNNQGNRVSHFHIYRMSSPDVNTVAVDWTKYGYMLGLSASNLLVLEGKRAPVSPPGAILITNSATIPAPVSHGLPPVRELSAPEVPRRELLDIIVSPQGDRLLCEFLHQSHIPKFSLDRSFPFLNLSRRTSHELWTCSLDGSGLRKLVRFDVGADFGCLKWRPDGRRVTFISNHALWAVPAEH